MSAKKNIAIVRVFISLVFFVSIISIGVVSIIDPDRSKSELENRSLVTTNDLDEHRKLSSAYFSTFDDYFNDQLFIRDSFIELDGQIKKTLLRQNIVDGVYIDESGEMYEPVPKGKVDPEKAGEEISEFAKILKLEDINVVFAPAPNKATFFEDRLPFYVNNAKYGNDFLDLLIANSSKETNVVDLRQTLKEVSKTHEPYFYTDHHWTIESVYAAYQTIMEKLNSLENGYSQPLPRSHYSTFVYRDQPFFGSFARRVSLANSNKRDYIKLLEPRKVDSQYSMKINENIYSEFNFLNKLINPNKFANRYEAYGSDNPRIVITNLSRSYGNRLLILKDSYSNPMLQFLAAHVSELHALDIRHFDEMSVLEYVRKYQIDDVLIVQNNLGMSLNPSTSNLL